MKFFTVGIPNAFRALGRVLRRLFSEEPVFVPPKVADQRLSVCNGCALNSGGVCTACRCVLSVKTLLATEKCPTNKW